MSIQNDETLQMYLEESFEHLSNIENDLLTIEADGAAINEELVNKVYRAAHSIKGGAGFMGLTNIKNLTHEMENILGRIRSREIIPESDIVNVLLKASDALKALMNDVMNSNDVDISKHLAALQSVQKAACGSPNVAADEPSERLNSEEIFMEHTADTSLPSADGLKFGFAPGENVIAVESSQLRPLFDQGKCLYLVKMRIEEDILGRGKSFQGVLEEMEQTGLIVAANFSVPPAAQVQGGWRPAVDTLMFIFATILKPSDINVLFEIDAQRILEIRSDWKLYELGGREASHAKTDGAAPGTSDHPARRNGKASATKKNGSAKSRSIKHKSPPPADAVSAIETSPGLTPGDGLNETASAARHAKIEQETSLRVHVSLLDQLMTLAGELVLSRNQLLQSMASSDQRASEIAGQRIDLITSELQEAIMLTRMQSIGNVFNKFPRVVRDLARDLDKRVELTLEGNEVELDKTIIEAIGDPLIHLVRNAVDHGIEKPDVRQKLGKHPTGQVFLKAYHEAGQVNIEIADDGRGLDGNKLAAKAVEKGLITEEQAKIMSMREKTNLIFLPGFSTADKVTDVSGRGVGMDVVKTNLDKLGGIIDIDSEIGHGTTIRIKLPLTLAIIPCQIVLTGGERYAIPQVNLEELLRIPAAQIRERIERVGDADVVRLRGNLLPLIRLADVIDADSFYQDPESGRTKISRRKSLADRRAKKSPLVAAHEQAQAPAAPQDQAPERSPEDRRYHAASALNIVVVSTGAMKYGLVVDELHDSEEIVVKPLGRDLKKCKGYAGATIMGDGRVALILDVSNLASMAGLMSMEGTARAAEVADDEHENMRASRDKQSLLIFRSSEEEQFAAPLNLVERIEKIKHTDIEEVGGKRVIKYRGGSLPLFSMDQATNVKPLADAENLLVIVFIVAGREVGLLAIGPVDAIEINIEIDGQTLRQAGIMGSAIINDHTTLLIDIHEIIQTLNPQWFENQDLSSDFASDSATILFAEDSTFFRNQVRGSMEKEGFNVLEAEDGVIAWDLLQENSDRIRLVVTDIEMPNMDGFMLTKKIKESSAFGHLPVIALTTLAGEEDISRGKSVGVDDYQIKLDREKLIQSIHNFLKAA